MMRRWLLSLLLAPAVLAQAPPPPPVPQAVAALAHLRPRADAGPSSWTNGPYDYDDAGNITWIGSESYVYDKLSRLRTAILRGPDLSAMQTQTFQYDVYGNLISTSKLGQTVPLPTTVATNRLESLGYDASGNVTAAGTVQYAYDAVGMLNTVRVGSSAQPRIIYGYTADDERLFAFDVSTGVTHWTLRGLDNKVLRDFKQQGSTWSVERDYVYRDGFLLAALKSAGAVEHYTLDHLGTPRLITDGSGQKVGYHVYWPFGEEWTAGTSQDGAPLKFTGHERDADPSGGAAPLDYMHARYYGAGWGRFLGVNRGEPDPSVPAMWNRYAYAINNPVRFHDPDGKQFDSGWQTQRERRQLIAALGPIEGERAYRQMTAASVKGGVAGLIAATALRFGPAMAGSALSFLLRPGVIQQTGEAVVDFFSPPSPISVGASPFVPGPVNSEWGKLDYLLGEVAHSNKSIGLGGFFKGELGFRKLLKICCGRN